MLNRLQLLLLPNNSNFAGEDLELELIETFVLYTNFQFQAVEFQCDGTRKKIFEYSTESTETGIFSFKFGFYKTGDEHHDSSRSYK